MSKRDDELSEPFDEADIYHPPQKSRSQSDDMPLVTLLLRSLLVLLACVAVIMAVKSCDAVEMTHAQGHDVYKAWRSPGGYSCCNARKIDEHGNITGDCRGVKHRITEKGLEIYAESQWVVVPENRIIKEPSPDGGVHACISPPSAWEDHMPTSARILCIVTPFNG